MKLQAAALATALMIANVPAMLAQTGFSDKDKTFLKDATQDNLAEIKMAELALKTSKNPEVRTFATKMITDHKALLVGSKPVAAKAGVTPPTTPSATAEASYLKLKVLSGETFDKSYVKTAVSDHHEDLNKARIEHDETKNADMKKLSAHVGEVVAAHDKMIDAIAAKMGVS